MDSFEVEAVSLGHLKRIIVGHDGTGPGTSQIYCIQQKLMSYEAFVNSCRKHLKKKFLHLTYENSLTGRHITYFWTYDQMFHAKFLKLLGGVRCCGMVVNCQSV